MNAHDFDAIVSRHDLNEHPFYRAWRAGTLPPCKLGEYAAEYAPFIESIEAGWRRLGNGEHADQERAHARLWTRFRDAVGFAGALACPEAAALVEEAHRSFADPFESLGTLYAFESQQPSTARSKLDGLRAHYALDESATEYFRVHADDYGEREDLVRLVDTLTHDDRARARMACERACVGMWSALSGILGEGEAG
jgi:pyrroloquinoline-quinone synthase